MSPKEYCSYIVNNKVKLSRTINMKDPLVLLSKSIDWIYFDNELGKTYNPTIGRPGINTRLMVSLHYLKYSKNLSDRGVLELWIQNPYWQYFSGMKYFVHVLPIHHSSMTRWRQRIGEVGVEKLLKETIDTGLKLKIIKSFQLEDINVDTTVQEKFIRFPTDSRLYYRAIQRLAKSAKKFNIILREDYAKLSEHLRYKQSRYMHTKHNEKVKEYRVKLKICLGKIVRDFQNSKLVLDVKTKIEILTARNIYFQEKHSKNKIYSFHALEVECIAKGKLHKEFEFGNKVSIAATSKGGWIVGALAFHGIPHDSRNLNKALWQIYRIIGIFRNVFVDMGYRGHNFYGKAKVYIKKWTKGLITDNIWTKLKRSVAIEPTIGHLKNTYRMNHNRLKGRLGDCINVILSAAGMNFKKLLNAIFLFLIYLQI